MHINTNIDMTDALVVFGGAIKSVGTEGEVEGWLVRFTSDKDPDLSGEFFTKNTDFDVVDGERISFYWDHGLDSEIGLAKIGEGAVSIKSEGVWVAGKIELKDVDGWTSAKKRERANYEKAIRQMADEGLLGWSSGTAAHLVEKKSVGGATEITKWPLRLDATLTPTPCEARNEVIPVKSLKGPSLKTLMGIKSKGPSASDKASILSNAITEKYGPKREDACYYSWWSWVVDVFDKSVVFTMPDGDGDTDYFEIGYKLDGLTVSFVGEPVQVERMTQYKPVKAEADGDDTESGMKSVKSKSNTVAAILQAKIHQAFTVAADELAVRGYLDVPQRIAISQCIGDCLKAFASAIDPDAGGVAVDSYDVDFIAAKSLKTVSEAIKSLNDLRFHDHSESVRTAVKEYTQRAGDYAKVREEKGKNLADERAEEFKAIRDELEAAIKALDEVLTRAPATKTETGDLERLRREAICLDPHLW